MSCYKCDILMELFKRTPGTNRDYWLMTELFVMIHGSDICDKAKPMKYGMLKDMKKDKDTIASNPGFKPDGSPSKWGCP